MPPKRKQAARAASEEPEEEEEASEEESSEDDDAPKPKRGKKAAGKAPAPKGLRSTAVKGEDDSDGEKGAWRAPLVAVRRLTRGFRAAAAKAKAKGKAARKSGGGGGGGSQPEPVPEPAGVDPDKAALVRAPALCVSRPCAHAPAAPPCRRAGGAVRRGGGQAGGPRAREERERQGAPPDVLERFGARALGWRAVAHPKRESPRWRALAHARAGRRRRWSGWWRT